MVRSTRACPPGASVSGRVPPAGNATLAVSDGVNALNLAAGVVSVMAGVVAVEGDVHLRADPADIRRVGLEGVDGEDDVAVIGIAAVDHCLHTNGPDAVRTLAGGAARAPGEVVHQARQRRRRAVLHDR